MKTIEWVVMVQEKIKIGNRTVADDVDRSFTVWATTAAAARQAVKNAGHDRISSVERAETA